MKKDEIIKVLKIMIRNKLSLLGIVIILALIIIALLAPFIAPYPEQAKG